MEVFFLNMSYLKATCQASMTNTPLSSLTNLIICFLNFISQVNLHDFYFKVTRVFLFIFSMLFVILIWNFLLYLYILRVHQCIFNLEHRLGDVLALFNLVCELFALFNSGEHLNLIYNMLKNMMLKKKNCYKYLYLFIVSTFPLAQNVSYFM